MRARGCETAQPMCKLAASSHGCNKVVPSRARELASSRDETICPQRGELAICELAICELAARRACNVRADNLRTYEVARLHARGEASSPCASSWYARLYTRGEASLQYASSQFARLHARGEASSQYARLPVQTRETVVGTESSPVPISMGHGITNSPTGIVPGGPLPKN